MTAKSMSPQLVQLLQKQLTHEMQASQAYLAMSLWCKATQYPGFAEFFAKQSMEEREHAMKVMNHLLDRGVLPVIGDVLAPKSEFETLMETAELARTLERENTAGIHAAYDAALAVKDHPAAVMLQWFISEQVEEEAWTEDLVVYVRRANCAGGLSQLDRHVVKMLGSDDDDE